MVPRGVNYAFHTHGYSNGKIVYLQLGELKAEAEERMAPPCHGRPPAPLSQLPEHSLGWIQMPPSRHFHPGGDPRLPSPTQTPLCPVFPREVGVCCLPGHSSVAGEDSTYFTLC